MRALAGRDPGVPSAVSRELLVVRSARRGPDVATIDLHPGVGILILRLTRETDHELRIVSLRAEQPVEHQGRPEAARVPGTEAQGALDDPSESLRLEGSPSPRRPLLEPLHQLRERMTSHL